jgi:hypothetical protein
MTNADRQQLETLQDRYGLRVAARLSMGTQTLRHDVTERLKAARMQALARRRVAARAPASAVLAAGSAAVLGGGDEPMNIWSRLAMVLPLVVLVLGLVTIHSLQNERVAGELAAVDAALLADDLPPAAYADPGFARFVELRRRQAQ